MKSYIAVLICIFMLVGMLPAVALANGETTDPDEVVPASNTDAAVVYTVTVTNDGNGTASADAASGEKGTVVTLTAVPNDGYVFKEWQVVSGGVTVADNKFTIGEADVEVKAIFEEDNSAADAVRTTTDICVPRTRIVKGGSLTIQATVEDENGRAVSGGKVALYIDDQCYISTSFKKGSSVTWSIPATTANKLGEGTHTVYAVYSGSANYESSQSDKVKVKVVEYCAPAPCDSTHYCCGEEHYNGKCVTVRAGEDVTFKVDIKSNETCQWYVDKGDGYGFAKIAGATRSSFTVENVTGKQDGYRYRCVVENCCETVAKPIFTLNIASGQLYTPKTGDSSVITIAAGCAALAALMLVGNRRGKRAK